MLAKLNERASAMESVRALESEEQQRVVRAPVNGRLTVGMTMTKEVKIHADLVGIVTDSSSYVLEVHAPLAKAAKLMQLEVITAEFAGPNGPVQISASPVVGSLAGYLRSSWGQPEKPWGSFSAKANHRPDTLPALSHIGFLRGRQASLPAPEANPEMAGAAVSNTGRGTEQPQAPGNSLSTSVEGLLVPAWTLDVDPEAEGIVKALRVRPGDPVQAGDVLGEIREEVAKAACGRQLQCVAQAEAELEAVQQGLRGSEAHLTAERLLVSSGALAELEFRDRQWGTERAKATVRAAEARLRSERAELGGAHG